METIRHRVKAYPLTGENGRLHCTGEFRMLAERKGNADSPVQGVECEMKKNMSDLEF
jgi:hypothetical protein